MSLDLANLRQLPGLAHRPNFPHGLQVLLVDTDFKARTEAESQLKEMGYSTTPCSCSAEAAAYLSNPENSVDVLLVDVRCLQQKTAENSTVVLAARTVPLVLMSEGSAPNEVMLGIKLGAVDFLEKPLSPLKLKNIWQHTVRRLIAVQPSPAPAVGAAPACGSKKQQAAAAAVGPMSAALAAATAGLPAQPEDSGGSHGSGGESGSNASTSERAPVKMELDVDMMETSSFADAAAPGNAAGGAAADTALLDIVVDSKSKRPVPQKYKAARGGAGAGNAKPCMGYPAGQLPALPNVPGIEWGLPTNPLQICPKPPGGGLLGSMPWANPLMNPAALFSPPMMLNAAATPAASSMTSVASMPTLAPPQHQQHHPQPSSSAAACAAPGGASGQNAMMACAFKRADSAPLPSLHSSSSTATIPTIPSPALSCTDLMMMPPPPPPASMAARVSVSGAERAGSAGADLFLGLDADKTNSRPPIGLQLKKSPSLLDFISKTLKHGDATISAC